ncbi:type IV pilus twitching motility protein PilT [Domibacillus enclensis]|uniref:Twitching motility protein PilT n=1 Tax=Domibacillus enclensis TaxID=1017273 RepID=A0A1N6Q0L9_9BACI|nr:type IV pilus twitching motility protein PilT [Domibacillus enclensis]OXS80544.1 type IV pili twitching motility protein PilT [Domibacillus enclensis]SIQ10093.1 twitching motility protein PilT [Domibacillus enclensis]
MREKLEFILRSAFELKASDIHLTVGTAPVLRIHGDLKRYGKDPLKPADTEAMAKAIVPETMWETFKEKGELDFSFGLPRVSRFRVNAYHQRNCIALAFRVIASGVPSLEDLHMPDILKKVSERPHGLVLVTGPTGSGKSTTLASMIDYLNRNTRKHIITLEDPIEYLHKHGKCIIDQREVGYDTQTFANGLRAALRQDPDVILVGEMRDLETIQTAITAAETGHLVFATLHTSSAPATIERIIDVFPAEQQPQIRTQLATVLTAVIAQRLFPTADLKGRRAALEIMLNNSAVANLIRSEKVHQIVNVIQTSKAQGMQLMTDHAQELFRQEVVAKSALLPYLRERE